MTDEAIEAEIVEEEEETTTELATKKDEALSVPAGTPAISVKPRMFDSIAEAMVYQKQQLDLVVAEVLEEGKHFGKIPGTDNMTLLKPGAAALFQAFQLRATPEVVSEDVDDDYYGVTIRINVHNQSGEHVGGGLGFASSDESKWQRAACPDCGETVYYNGPPKGGKDTRPDWKRRKADEGAMYSCKDYSGCGWVSMDPAPKGYSPDLRNTILKMAEKRARVDAALAVTGADAFFTQDMDDKVAAPERPSKASREGGVASPSSPSRTAPVKEWSGLAAIRGGGRNEDMGWALRICPFCSADKILDNRDNPKSAQSINSQEWPEGKKPKAQPNYRCGNEGVCFGGATKRDGTHYTWASFRSDPWEVHSEIDDLMEVHLDGGAAEATVVEPKGETDPGKWLNLILKPIVKDDDDRRKRVTAAMKKLGFKNPMSQAQASEVSEAVMEKWYLDNPDEALF